MTAGDARGWIVDRYGDDCEARLSCLADIVIDENRRQNLIAASTIPDIWSRHILDSAQLLEYDVTNRESVWSDIGSGAGFPGLVIAILSARPVVLVEPRRRRAEFLQKCGELLGLAQLTVVQSRAETFRSREPADVISARAVASIDALFEMTRHLVQKSTRYILPRGQSAADEVEKAAQHWHGLFHVKQSLSDPAAGIVIADRVRPK